MCNREQHAKPIVFVFNSRYLAMQIEFFFVLFVQLRFLLRLHFLLRLMLQGNVAACLK